MCVCVCVCVCVCARAHACALYSISAEIATLIGGKLLTESETKLDIKNNGIIGR